MRSKLASATALALVVTLPGLSAIAQGTDGTSETGEDAVSVQDTITVTARKREESLLEVPTTVTAIAPGQVQDLRLGDARDIFQIVPSAYLQENNAGTARDISIRGISTPTLFAEPGVALYIDEIYSSGFISYPTQFRDLERVEVLRGPQGALYGRNAVGGAVNVLSKRPESEFGGHVRGALAGLDRQEIEGVLNVPLGDQAAIRGLVWYDDQNEGEYFNITTGEYLDSSETTGGRLTGVFNPTDNLTLTALVEQETAEGPGTYLFFPDAGETEKTIERDTQPSNDWDAFRYSVSAELDTDIGSFTFVAGGRDYELDGVEDTDLSASNVVDLLTGQLGQQITTRQNIVESTFLEARWLSPEGGPVTFLGGLTYLDENAEGDILTDLAGLSQALASGLAPFTLGIENNQSVTSWAAFAELTYDINERLSLTGSARYTEDEKDVDFLFTPTPTLFGFVGPAQTAQVEDTFSNFSPGITLAYRASDALNVYGKIQTGFRAGGFNFNVANAANLAYDEETSINYELGAKKSIQNGKGFVAANIYLLQQDDVLVPVLDQTAPPGLQGFLINAGEAESIGVELEGSIQIVEGWTIQGSLGYQDAEFTAGSITDFFGATVPLDGLVLPASREWTGAVVSTYRTPITQNWDFVANGSYTSRSDGFQDIQNTVEISGNELLNISVGVETDTYQLLGFVQNATDDQYDLAFGGFRPPAAVGVTRARGAVYGVTLAASF